MNNIVTGDNKKWHIANGIVQCNDSGGNFIPSADALYCAVFENKFTGSVNKEDITFLRNLTAFSRYPADIKIRLFNSFGEAGIQLSVTAITSDGVSAEVDWDRKADHIVIDKNWYPFVPGAIDDIKNILAAAGVQGPGPVRLGQYLTLLKNDNDYFFNEVVSSRPASATPTNFAKPPGIKADLYSYQLTGWKWLEFMLGENIGGILADEMGLGKTLQVIALFCTDPPEAYFPSVIVAPTTLLENWRREFTKFAPHISTHIHQGPQRTGFPAELSRFQIVITSYDIIIRDAALFNQIKWVAAVCDEAQAIKNPAARRSVAIKRIPRQVGIAVTGTPVENGLTDLWSIMDFAVPGFLGAQSDFERRYEQTLEGAARLERMISPLILRRRVAEVAKDLPAKIIIPQVLELSDNEINAYEHIREETALQFEGNASLVVLNRLRMFCAHPFLVNDRPGEDPAQFSNKYARLVEISEEIVLNAAKMIVFTSYSKMNDIITGDLARRFNIFAASIDGRTPASERQRIVDTFSDTGGAALLVLNPIAAGTGLNITAANHVIHYNLEWNPAKEDQASARAYRRGQDRPVTIHRLFYSGTVEEVINERLDRKRLLAGNAVVGITGETEDYSDILSAIQRTPKLNK